MTSAVRRCPLFEANCGFDLRITDGDIVTTKPRRTAVLSQGFAFKKGLSLGEVNVDSDRVTQPLVRRDGQLVPVMWEEAFTEAERLLSGVLARQGSQSVATYRGNPRAVPRERSIAGQQLAWALGTKQTYSSAFSGTAAVKGTPVSIGPA